MAITLTSLIGRDDDIATIANGLASGSQRLLTLTGPGGIGKTRLALAVLQHLRSTTPAQATVLLSDVTEPDGLLDAIARAINLQVQAREDTADAVIDAIGEGRFLLLLDNLEHLLEGTPAIVDLLLACPGLAILATSRAPLHLTGEHVVEVAPLPMPDVDHLPALDALAAYPAIRLFVERARATAPGFTLTARNGPTVARICHQLDGIPLAIELAAAQVTVLPPAALLTRIEQHIPLPIPGPRNASPQRRTLRGMIDWSYGLLSSDDQAIFRVASVFAGGFTATSLERVIALSRHDGDGNPAADVLSSLARIHGHSLLDGAAGSEAPRFSLLHTVRRFARQRLAEAGEEDRLRSAHAAWSIELASGAEMAAITPGAGHELRTLENEHANLLAALEWLHASGEGDALLRLAVALAPFWFEHAHYREGAEWLRRARHAAPGAPPVLRARATVALGVFCGFRSDPEAARELLDEGMAVLRKSSDAGTIALARIWEGGIALRAGDHDAAERSFREALAEAATIESRPVAAAMQARALSNLGTTVHERGNLDEAARHLHHALETCRDHDYVPGMIRAHRDLGDLHRDQGDFAGSVTHYQACLSLMQEVNDPRAVMDALEGTALALAVWGEHQRAARLLGVAAGIADELGQYAGVASDRAAHRRTLAILQAALGQDTLRREMATGGTMLIPDAIELVVTSTIPARAGEPADGPLQLSPREEEVLRLVAEGLSDKEIGTRLFLSVRTIEAHMLRIRTRFGVRTRTAAVTAAIARGLLEVWPESSGVEPD